MIWIYDALWLLALSLGLPLWLPWALVSARRRRALVKRFLPLPRVEGTPIWIHAASVGEAEAAAPVVRELEARGLPLLLTTTSTRGRDRLRELFPALRVRLAPLDAPGLAAWAVRRVRPAVLALIETEIWPNLIRATRARGGRVVILSARISDRSYPRYRRAAPLVRRVLSQVDRIAARSDEDAARFVALGAVPERVAVLGDLKLDRPPGGSPGPALRRAVGEGPFLLGASTHAGEEEVLLNVWRELRDGPAPGLRLMLAPRHPERTGQVCVSARRHHARYALRSAGAAEAEVVIVDTVGELASLYALAELVFCGGTLANVGGHNLFEPIQAGRVAVIGPHARNQRHQVQLLRPLGVLHEVGDARTLREMLFRLWEDPKRNEPAEAAREVLERHRGAARRAADLVLELSASDA